MEEVERYAKEVAEHLVRKDTEANRLTHEAAD